MYANWIKCPDIVMSECITESLSTSTGCGGLMYLLCTG